MPLCHFMVVGTLNHQLDMELYGQCQSTELSAANTYQGSTAFRGPQKPEDQRLYPTPEMGTLSFFKPPTPEDVHQHASDQSD